MSAGFSVAAATAALADRLHALIGDAVPGARVATLNPGASALRAGEPIANLYLFRALRNGAITNRDLPTRDAGGRPKAAPALALDLDYMITLFGDDARLEPQRLLGLIAGGLHAEPYLPPTALRAAIAAAPWLAGARTDAQEEAIRVTPIALPPDAMARLWSEFVDVPYQLTLLYTATPVIVEVPVEVAPVLPLRRFGVSAAGTGPIRFGPVVNADDPAAPIQAGGWIAVRIADPAGFTVQLDRRDMRGEPGTDARGHPAVLVRLDDAQPGPPLVGPAAVRVAHAGRAALQSHEVRVLIVPGFNPPPSYAAGEVVLPLALPVRPGSQVALQLYPLDRATGPARRLSVPVGDAPQRVLRAAVGDVVAGTYLVGVTVDGLASVLAYDGARYTGPRVTIPEPSR